MPTSRPVRLRRSRMPISPIPARRIPLATRGAVALRLLVALGVLVAFGMALTGLPGEPVAASERAPATPEPTALDGRVLDTTGHPVVGAMVSASDPVRGHRVSVFSDAEGRFVLPAPAGRDGALALRVRRIGFRDLALGLERGRIPGVLRVAREADPAALAAQLPANRWWSLVLERLDDPVLREELVRQCTYCHQQGSEATRRRRSDEEWQKLLDLMGRMGGIVSPALRARIPALLTQAYDPAHAVPALTARADAPDFAPPPPPAVRRARIDEWTLGGRASMQHDIAVLRAADGDLVYSVDMTQDRLYRLDPSVPDGDRRDWAIPRGGLPLGGVFASSGPPLPPTSNAHVGPHSLQVAPDGALWITLALGNRLARFDPASESFRTHELADGYYPHTLRFDARGRIWYTLAASNHLGMHDPATGESRQIRLPAESVAQDLTLRLLPVFLWIGRHVDLRGLAARSGEGAGVPIPYGIDVAPDGGIWFSQLNAHRIGRLDPDDFSVEVLDTPFPAPRRLRFDPAGRLWIPSFSGARIARFDPRDGSFREWPLPIEPAGSDTPYALNVDPRSGAVWICGTNSDTLIRFEPGRERFTVFPLPTRVTYTREIDFDRAGRPWTSNSNQPAWQIEGGLPTVIRIDARD